MSKYCFEIFDRIMFNILKCDNWQILLIIINGGRVEIVLFFIIFFYLWFSCKVLELIKNMRFIRDVYGDRLREIEVFFKWIFDIENGKINELNFGEVEIDIFEDLLII